jgi:hypothetical protein
MLYSGGKDRLRGFPVLHPIPIGANDIVDSPIGLIDPVFIETFLPFQLFLYILHAEFGQLLHHLDAERSTAIFR